VHAVIAPIARANAAFKKKKKIIDSPGVFGDIAPHTETKTVKIESHMRTKTLLLTAAISAAGVLSSLAQSTNIYSVNVVGYTTLTIKHGYQMIANQLIGANNNAIGSVIPTAPAGTQIFYWSKTNQGYLDTLEFVPDVGWVVGEEISQLQVPPGDAFFLYNPGAEYTLTLTGDVTQGTGLAVNLQGGNKYNLIAPLVPQSTGLSTQNFPQINGAQIFEFDATTQLYKDTVEYVTDVGWVIGEDIVDPTFAIGQGFFLRNPGTTQNWTRDFAVQ
jgi:hypothetical protein